MRKGRRSYVDLGYELGDANNALNDVLEPYADLQRGNEEREKTDSGSGKTQRDDGIQGGANPGKCSLGAAEFWTYQ